MPLVRELTAWNVLTLVAVTDDDQPCGHIMFSPCSLAGRPEKLALLGPLAVTPARQRQGLGRALVGEGLRHLNARGLAKVLVLGDPAYYGRLGFAMETGIAAPYTLPDDWATAWQSMALTGAGQMLRGALEVLPPWQKPSLWTG